MTTRDGVDPVIVCGAGAAGMAAALAAARSGARVHLVECSGGVGGTVASALIHTLAGLYTSRGELLNEGLCAELVERLAREDSLVRPRRMGRVWVLSVWPDLYRRVVDAWIRSEPNITVLPHSQASRVTVEGGRVVGVEIVGRHQALALRPRAVIDATGGGEFVRRIDPALVQKESSGSTAGLIFRLRGVEPGAMAFPRGAMLVRLLRAAAAQGKLPGECEKAWIDAGLHKDEAFVKLFVPLPPGWRVPEERVEIARRAYWMRSVVVAFLRELPEFAHAWVVQFGRLGVRDGGRVQGEYCLTGDDVRRMRKFDDAACRGCWPIEYWDHQRGVSVEYLPEDDYYEIPRRALEVKGLDNVWVAGKCLSADGLAQASARVVGTCWAMGEAVGKAAVSQRRLIKATSALATGPVCEEPNRL